MKRVFSIAGRSLVLVAWTLILCQCSDSAKRTDEPPADTPATAAGDTARDGLVPIAQRQHELLAEAMAGLLYDGERVMVDPDWSGSVSRVS